MPDISDGIIRHIESYLDNHVFTAIPARVTKVSSLSSEQLVDVQPLVSKRYEDSLALKPTALESLPVVFPSAGGGILSFPIKVGDTVLVIFNKYSIEDWMETDGQSPIIPTVTRSFSLSDGVVIPSLYTTSSNLAPNPTDVELKFKGMSIKLEDGGDVSISNSNGYLTLKADGSVLSNGATITTDGDFITASGISLDNHTHPILGGSSAPGPTGVPT